MIKTFDNLKIKQKLTVAFTFILILTILMGGYSVSRQMSTIKQLRLMEKNQIDPTSDVVEIYNSFQRVRLIALKAVTMSGSETRTAAEAKELTESTYKEIDYLNTQIDELVKMINDDPEITLKTEGILDVQDKLNNGYVPYIDHILEHAENGEYQEALEALNGAVPLASAVSEPLETFLDNTIENQKTTMDKIESTLAVAQTVTIIILLIVLICSLIISQLVAKNLSKKINAIANSVKRVSQGDFSNTEIFNSRDELGQLSRYLASCVDTIHNMVSDTKELGRRQGAGEFSFRLNVDLYSGEYKEMMVAVNDSFTELLTDVDDLIIVLNEYTAGNFEAKLRTLKGDKISVNNCVNQLKDNLVEINTQITNIIDASSQGNVRYRAEVGHFDGDWKKIIVGLNDLLDQICTPFDEVGAVLVEMSKGNLQARIMGDYKGEYDSMKNLINNSMHTISSYINIIDDVLEGINNNDLTLTIQEDFVGDFNNLKVAINQINLKLNDVFKEFLVGADEVAIGAQQISNSSISLADGAAEQVTSLQTLTNGVQNVSESSSKNASSAARANEISEVSRQNAVTGDEQMKQMLVSMNEISESSNEISNIIKVIEDIAFQTNLLALNAAVEAARAGAHGKGFAVVAEEVRTLAARSSQAAKETTELIETSIQRVAYGSELAKKTAHALDEIVNNVSDVANIIEEISVSSKEQAHSVDQINDEIKIVENVVLKTSAASEEGVSTAEELSSQSTVLRDLIGTFKLKN